jgi:hypothetical protein
MEPLYHELRRIGYYKFVQKAANTILVYVSKAERFSAMQDIARKLGGIIDKSPVTMRKISSLGGIIFDKAPFKNFLIGIKPDASTGLSTDEQETLAGIFIATKLNNPSTDYSLNDLMKYGDTNVRSKHTIEKLYDKAGKGWILSSTTIAEKMFTLYKGSTFIVHQRSKSVFVDNISAAAKNLIKQSGHVMGLDKWNPADIWLVSPSLERTNFNQFKTIQELNAWIQTQHSAKKVIGVSLKQVGKTAKAEVYNTGNAPVVKYMSYDVGKTGFLNAINATIYFNGGSFVLRSFGRPVSINAEINGKLAQGGKVGSGPLFDIVKRYEKSFKTMTHQDISNLYESKPLQIAQMLLDRMEKIEPATARKYTANTLLDVIKQKSNDLIYVISKIQSSDIVIAVQQMDAKTKNDFISAIIAYASSSTSISSMFTKVS